jgi:hypothetical protein
MRLAVIRCREQSLPTKSTSMDLRRGFLLCGKSVTGATGPALAVRYLFG